jgi:hypothetical protein
MMDSKEFKNFFLKVETINVNTMNVSALGTRNAKTYLKIEDVTGKKADIIFMCDIRAANKGDDLEKLFRMTRNGNYNLYLNSTRNSRGVGIAIKKSISHEIKGIVRDVRNENYILLDIVIKGRRLTLGSIYGPNENNVNFYKEIKRLLGLWKNNFFIIGGDFNTILDMDRTADNLDRIGAGRIPNKSNGEFINEWIRKGSVVELFCALYPEEREVSYLSYWAMVGGEVGRK